MRIFVPFGPGGTVRSRSVGSGSSGATGAGVASVDHSSWKTAPSAAVRVTGGGPSDRKTDVPPASWPVTTRLGVQGSVTTTRLPERDRLGPGDDPVGDAADPLDLHRHLVARLQRPRLARTAASP